MAIHKDYSCPVIQICVDNPPLPEYGEEYTTNVYELVLHYTEINTGQEFVIKFKSTEPVCKDVEAITSSLMVDGEHTWISHKNTT